VCHLKKCCDEGIVELRHIETKYQLALPAPAFIPLQDVCVCVYYCSTYYKAVRVGEGG
jgi:hypothetical protein